MEQMGMALRAASKATFRDNPAAYVSKVEPAQWGIGATSA
jgi:hypothetical protein